MAVATKIQLQYLEDTGIDGKKLYTPKEWTERIRHYIKNPQHRHQTNNNGRYGCSISWLDKKTM